MVVIIQWIVITQGLRFGIRIRYQIIGLENVSRIYNELNNCLNFLHQLRIHIETTTSRTDRRNKLDIGNESIG